MTRTDIIRADERGQVATSSPKPKPPSAILRRHLGPHLACGPISAAVPDFLQAIARLRDHYASWGEETREKHRAEAVELARHLPAKADLERERAVYAEAAEGRVTRPEIGAIVGAMLDAIPTYSAEKSPGYLDVMLLTLELEAEAAPFSAAALAGACYQLARSETFAPSPDAVVEAVRQKQRDFASRAGIWARVLGGLAKLRAMDASDA